MSTDLEPHAFPDIAVPPGSPSTTRQACGQALGQSACRVRPPWGLALAWLPSFWLPTFCERHPGSGQRTTRSMPEECDDLLPSRTRLPMVLWGAPLFSPDKASDARLRQERVLLSTFCFGPTAASWRSAWTR